MRYVFRYIWIGITALLIGLPLTSGADDDSATDDQREPALIAQIARIRQQVSDLRGLSLNQPVPDHFISRSAIRRELDAEAQPPDPNNPLNQFYIAFDLYPDDGSDIQQTTNEINAANIGGYYDLIEREIFVVLDEGDDPGKRLSAREQVIYAHEFTHALQDQHFEVTDILWFTYTNETYMAALAFIEGDAMFTQELFILDSVQNKPEDDEILAVRLLGEMTPPKNAPDIIRAELDFVYLGGMNFIKTLYETGGWSAVNSVYDDPPIATSHILHPQDYMAGVMPRMVSVNSLIYSAFDDPEGWDRMREDTLGEFYLREYLATQLTPARVDEAATGWRGDRYILFYNRRINRRAWVLVTTWDRVADAQTFTRHYHQFAIARTADDSPLHRIAGVDCWTGDDGALCLRHRGGHEVVIAYAPTAAEGRAMIALQTD